MSAHCRTCAKLDAIRDHAGFPEDRPTRWWHCPVCGAHMERWRGQGDQACRCGAQFNASGQRLRDDWAANPSWADEDFGDLEGFEIAELRAEGGGS